jgi:hypothetical protein
MVGWGGECTFLAPGATEGSWPHSQRRRGLPRTTPPSSPARICSWPTHVIRPEREEEGKKRPASTLCSHQSPPRRPDRADRLRPAPPWDRCSAVRPCPLHVNAISNVISHVLLAAQMDGWMDGCVTSPARRALPFLPVTYLDLAQRHRSGGHVQHEWICAQSNTSSHQVQCERLPVCGS